MSTYITSIRSLAATFLTSCCILLAWLPATVCHSQIDTTIDFTTTFHGDRLLFLRDANKLMVSPLTKDSVVKMTAIQYTTLPTPKVVLIEPALIPVAKINVEEKLPYLYRGYVKAGYGTYNTSPIDFYFTDGRSKKGTFGVHYKLLRGDGVNLNDDDSIPDRYSDNHAEIWGKWLFNKTQLLAKTSWDRNLNHWYGVDVRNDYKGPDFDSLDFKQVMNTFKGGVSFLTYQRDTGDYNYRGDIAFRRTGDIYKNNEINFDLLLHGRRLVDSTLYAVDFGVNYNQFNYMGPYLDGTNLDITNLNSYNAEDRSYKDRSVDNAIVKLIPSAATTWRDLRAKVGLGIFIEGRGANPGHFYPMVETSYNFLDGMLVPYAGVKGSTTPTTYYSLYQQNPFVQSFPRLKNRNNRMDIYGGIGGAVSRTVSYNVGVNYQEFSNFEYFINDTLRFPLASMYSWGNMFTLLYDDLSAINFHGELAIYAGEKWKANVRADYFSFDAGNQAHAWHQPNLKVLANGQYSLKNKFIVNLDVFFIGQRWARSLAPIQGVEISDDGTYDQLLKGFADVNLKVEYRYNKRLGAWVAFNNALAMKYHRYNGYPTQTFVALMGASYSF
jgi:hypothetical protein